ncbi:MAG TPA: hypothetical protein VNA12_06975 [Mycobacteriales bacterium]|nr:hypothetical protein [Mycobacteriales bacterium]
MSLDGTTATRDAIDRVLAAVLAVGHPCAVSGVTAAALRSWGGFVVPDRPNLVVPATRPNVYEGVAAIRRIARWGELEIVEGPFGIPALGVIDGLFTLAPSCADQRLHAIVQELSYGGELDVRQLMRRRRTGLPGSARITRVGQRYLVGLDSPREVEVFNVLRSRGLPPDHLNVKVAAPDGRVVGPFDGYDELGAAYEVDSIFHTTDEQRAADSWKSGAAAGIGVAVVRFIGDDITSRTPMLEGWVAARASALARSAGAGLEVIHQPGRGCICGHVAA